MQELTTTSNDITMSRTNLFLTVLGAYILGVILGMASMIDLEDGVEVEG